jgi:hypothetical protein
LRIEVFRLALPDDAWPVFDSMNTSVVKFIIRVVVGFHLLCLAMCGQAGVVMENLFRVQPPGSPLIGAMTLKPSSLGSTANHYFGKSQWADPYLNGQIDEFRIYSVALSSAEIAATYALGPNQLSSTNSPNVAFSISGPNLTVSWPLVSASFTLQSSTNLASGNWVIVSSPAPQIIGTNYQVALPATNAIQFFRLSK